MLRCARLALAAPGLVATLACSPPQGLPPAAEAPRPALPAPAVPPPEPRTVPAPEALAENVPEPGTRTFYRYLDASGSLRIVDALASVPAAERSRAKPIVLDRRPSPAGTARATDAPTASPFARLASAEPASRGSAANVVIFTARWCGWCQQALAHLEARGVAYRNRDIDADPEAVRDLRRLTGSTSIPVLDIDGDVVRGFDVDRIDALLDATP